MLNPGVKVCQSLLVVDDVPENVDILVEHLQHERLHLMVALTGADAVKLATEAQPDLILLDVMMPGMDGYVVCRALRLNPVTKDIPVIFVTAQGYSESEEKGLALGAIDYICKPYNIPILKARVRNHLDLKKKTDLLAHLSYVDGLTNIFNRRRFDEILELEWRRCHRSGQSLSAIMIDVDYFKNYNDHYGHGKGDECLKFLAEAFQSVLRRASDTVARYGGEEFVILLPGTTAERAASLANTLRNKVGRLAIPHRQSKVANQITISLGVASIIPGLGVEATTLLEQADKALYEAKSHGRNICYVYQDKKMAKYLCS